MAIRLPEIPIHLPHTPAPETKGKTRWYQNPFVRIGASVATLAAGTGLAYQMFFNQDRGASAPLVSNAPITDIKPPSSEAPTIVITPPETQKIDKKANVDAAVQKGILEVKEGDFEKYFTAVTPEEAKKLLEEKGNSVFLLNLDPTKSPNLILQTLNIPTPTGVVPLTGAKNIGQETIVYASEPGTATIRFGNLGSDLIYSAKVKNGNRLSGGVFQRAGSIPLIPTDQEVPVNIGTPLASLGSEVGSLSFYPGAAQIATGFGVDFPQANQGSIAQLARTADGGIAYIPQGQK